MKPNQKLADALQLLKEIQDKQIVAIYTDTFKTVKHRQLLLKYGFIKEVSKGWYIASDPLEKEGETTFCSYPKGGTFTTKLDLKN